MTCGHYCRSRFPRSLWSKTWISMWVLFSVVMELGVPKLSWTSSFELHIASRTMRPWTSWNRNNQQKLQLTTFAVHNQAAVWVVARGGIFENLVKHASV